MNNFLWDMREAFRGLRKSPALVSICVLSLGLGVGVNLTLFSWLSAILFDQPTIVRPDEVVGIEPGNSNQLSYLNYRDLRDAGIFESVFGHRRTELSFRTGEMTQGVSGLAVSGNFFEGLDVRAQFGRVFTEAEASPERDARVAVASHAFWRRTLDADPNAVGRVLTLNGQPYTLVGVLPSDYRAVTPVESPDLYVPLNVLGPTNLSQRPNDNALLVMRRVIGFMLSSIGTFGLLLATIGVYGVMAYAVTSRTSEIAIQMALGASSHHVRWRVLGNGLKLVLIGVAIGTAVALAATRPLAAMLAGLSPSDSVTYVATAIALTVVGLAASYLPARRATRIDPMVALRQQ